MSAIANRQSAIGNGKPILTWPPASAHPRRNHLVGPLTLAGGIRVEAWTERRAVSSLLAPPYSWQAVVRRGGRVRSAAGPAQTEAAARRLATAQLREMIRVERRNRPEGATTNGI